MTDPRRPDAAALFDHAVGLPADARAAYLDEACAGDAALRAEVEALLRADAAADPAFLSGDDLGGLAAALAAATDPGPGSGDQVGAWRLLDELGRGGMGTVHLAERVRGGFTQRVAVKLVRPGMDTEELLARFRRERQLLAGLDHPHIARLVDGGVTPDGRPFLVMEHVDGQPVDAYCRAQRLDVPARLRLFLDVCGAVSHAHRHLVVHRDLKPGNVLVDARGRCKLLDFGIAKVLDPDRDDGVRTRTTARLLSPRYASPEQVVGDPVTTASDVYALGVILYELLAGRSPYPVDDTSLAELEKAVREHRPAPPSTTGGSGAAQDPPARGATLGPDLDAIVLKALRKEPARRYESVDALAADLRRYLDGRPVLARPDTAAYRLGKFVRRHRAPVAVAAVAALLLAGAAVVSTVQYVRAERQQRTAAGIGGFLQEMLASIDPEVARGQDTALLRGLLDRAAADLDAGRVPDRRAAADLHATVGRTYASIARYEEAVHHLEVAAAAAGDAARTDALAELGRVLHDAGRYEEAEARLREALAMPPSGRAARTAHARAHHLLGRTLEARGRTDEAEEHLRTAVADLDGAAGDAGAAARFAAVRGLAGFLTLNRQAYAEADSLLRVALALAEAGDGGVLAAPGTRMALSTNLRHRGDLAAAAALGREALAGYAAVLPADHPTLGSAKDELAGILEQREEWDEAETLYREALATLRDALGPDHRDVGTVANNLAGLLRKRGRHDEAAPRYAEAVRIYRAALGPDHAWLGIILGGQATNLAAAGRWSEAAAVTDACLRVRRLHWAEGHWRVQIMENLRGACLAARGDLAGADSVLTATRATIAAALGAEHPATRLADARLAALAELQAGGSPDSLR